jgi:hypothetical protein
LCGSDERLLPLDVPSSKLQDVESQVKVRAAIGGGNAAIVNVDGEFDAVAV